MGTTFLSGVNRARLSKTSNRTLEFLSIVAANVRDMSHQVAQLKRRPL